MPSVKSFSLILASFVCGTNVAVHKEVVCLSVSPFASIGFAQAAVCITINYSPMKIWYALPEGHVWTIPRPDVFIPKFHSPNDLLLCISKFCIIFSRKVRNLQLKLHHHWQSNIKLSNWVILCYVNLASVILKIPNAWKFLNIFFYNGDFKSAEWVMKFLTQEISSSRLSSHHLRGPIVHSNLILESIREAACPLSVLKKLIKRLTHPGFNRLWAAWAF